MARFVEGFDQDLVAGVRGAFLAAEKVVVDQGAEVVVASREKEDEHYKIGDREVGNGTFAMAIAGLYRWSLADLNTGSSLEEIAEGRAQGTGQDNWIARRSWEYNLEDLALNHKIVGTNSGRQEIWSVSKQKGLN